MIDQLLKNLKYAAVISKEQGTVAVIDQLLKNYLSMLPSFQRNRGQWDSGTVQVYPGQYTRP